jgi:peptidoglycan hydrolase-like protein with peptidoglycan-binding domain
MVERGWDLEVDGIYGPETESVAERFQAEKGLRVDGLVGINTWNAAWEAPIT